MACTAGDKLKASAREFLRNLETWKTQDEIPVSLESAIHKMFGSCTTPTEPLAGEDDGEESASRAVSERRSRRKMPSNHPVSQRTNKAEYGEHIYEQLFQDDQKNTSHHQEQRGPTEVTPSSRREPQHYQQRAPSSSPRGLGKSGRKMFPASSPKSSSGKQICTPLKSDHLIVQNDKFDDSISAISAYTLDAMAQVDPTRTRSLKSNTSKDDSTLFPASSHEGPSTPKKSPSSFHRNRSQQTSHSKLSRMSKTTNTTEDSSFEQRFADDEKHYWKGQSESPRHSSGHSKRSKSQSSRKTHDHTASTCGSSSASFAHPHDVIPFEPGDLLPTTHEEEGDFVSVFASDPDRLAQVLVLPDNMMDTEMAEI
eukprot:CAMPEP_0172453240 /NCGR_PEP_ID=MMETSP1065-20121228/10658_1 /TAXON_ID=265537 /ORGANISM="Amphiprora paludosa, Strain CCMP125" /LENGTH=367 /DNA_ID=CAMNT_0013205419 /DNA_START=325 /DNA_END=1428 /DNA_ORIENTATION=+